MNILTTLNSKIRTLPTPTAGLALGIGSIGLTLENTLPSLNGLAQVTGAVIAGTLLFKVASKFLLHGDTLIEDLKHPVVGSVVPTFAMGTMVVSKTVGELHAVTGQALWALALLLHMVFMVTFIYHRARGFHLSHMVPSWFVPPIGFVVGCVTVPEPVWCHLIAGILFILGAASYAIMLPTMLYRLMFHPEIVDGAKPTIAIMAAPASLCLAGYLTIEANPNYLIVSTLLGIAVLMTMTVYIALTRILRLAFTAGFAALTFPLAIGATALYKLAHHLDSTLPEAAATILTLAHTEAVIATTVITYVAVGYIRMLITKK